MYSARHNADDDAPLGSRNRLPVPESAASMASGWYETGSHLPATNYLTPPAFVGLDYPPGTIAADLLRGLPCRDNRGSDCRISVVFSFWNEEEVLPELIRRMRSVFDLLLACEQIGGYELIFVNDASTDRSLEILQAARRERPDIKIINMSRNFGVSECALAGMHFASGNAVIYMDADLQDPPEIIPDMIMRWKEDPEVQVVHTVRQSRQGETYIKKCITALGYTLLRVASSIDLPREAGDFKLLSARMVRHLIQFRERKPFMRGLICFLGFKQVQVHYHREPRYSGKSKFPVLGRKVIANFLNSALIAFSDLPLRFASVFAGLAMFGSLVSLAVLAARWFAGNLAAASGDGWLATAAVVLGIGGLQLMSISILGRFLGAIYFESKRRPNFIVSEIHGFAEPKGHELAHSAAHERVRNGANHR